MELLPSILVLSCEIFIANIYFLVKKQKKIVMIDCIQHILSCTLFVEIHYNFLPNKKNIKNHDFYFQMKKDFVILRFT